MIEISPEIIVRNEHSLADHSANIGKTHTKAVVILNKSHIDMTANFLQ